MTTHDTDFSRKNDTISTEIISNSRGSVKGHHTSFVSSEADISKTESLICGGIAGVASRFFVAPLDVVKIRLQLQTGLLSNTILPLSGRTASISPLKYRGIVSSILTITREEGLTALWKGNLPAELLYLVYGSTQFFIYRQSNDLINHYFPATDSTLQQFITGAASGALATVITYPLDLLRTRLAAQRKYDKLHSSFRHSAALIVRNEGLAGLFQGIRPALGQIVPYMGLFFMTYTPIKDMTSNTTDIIKALSNNRLDFNVFGTNDAISGMLAGVISKTGVFPLDVIRKRMQVQGPSKSIYVVEDMHYYPNSIKKCIMLIIRKEGWRGLYRGLWVSLIKAAPTSAITMWTFEHSITALRWLKVNIKEP
ncbi:mitochondrial carrier domain-containing protein [Dipodascopsis uninucleata]